jgi:hypothetical protein
LRDAKAPYVLVDQDPAAVDDLVRIGEPVIVDGAAGNEEGAREKNAKAHIIVRCYVDGCAAPCAKIARSGCRVTARGIVRLR